MGKSHPATHCRVMFMEFRSECHGIGELQGGVREKGPNSYQHNSLGVLSGNDPVEKCRKSFFFFLSCFSVGNAGDDNGNGPVIWNRVTGIQILLYVRSESQFVKQRSAVLEHFGGYSAEIWWNLANIGGILTGFANVYGITLWEMNWDCSGYALAWVFGPLHAKMVKRTHILVSRKDSNFKHLNFWSTGKRMRSHNFQIAHQG